MPRRHRFGFLKSELIVVLVIVLTAIGLLLVLLGQGRGQAQRLECANHLRLLGEAISSYHGTNEKPGNGALPPARIADGYATWAIALGAYLAAADPFAAWDMRKSYSAQTAAAREVVLPMFLCPARNRQQGLSAAGDFGRDGNHLAGALSDYACASGDGDPRFPWTGPSANGAIVLGEVLVRKDDLILRWQSRTSYTSLIRSKSATLVLGEKHVPLDRLGQADVGDGSLFNGGNPASFSRIGGPGFGLATSANDPFNSNFGSAHTGLCNFLHADGSVRPYENSLAEDVLGQLIRRE